ncbi:hypothetical protein F4859DRAFT_372709 [Xylaria cf. heliscus]|nr:hypothetical protein F4859DRAFT_372709 [Xylaria cf. heliscus]
MSSSATAPNGAVQKHRACDECRIRKLACTKEVDGCSRCRREEIPCHYSAQKPMGRPRKRPRESSEEKPITAAPPTKMTMTEQPPDTEDPGMQFINLLLGTDFDFDPLPPPLPRPDAAITATTTTTTTTTTPTAAPQLATIETPVSMRDPPWDYHNLGDVNFDSQPAEHVQSFSPANIDPALFSTTPGLDLPPTDQVPALSPPNSNATSSPQSSGTSPTAAIPSDCGCTASLYSALNWMQRLPSEVEPAIRQARLAAKVAYEVVNCTTCSYRLDPAVQHQVGSPFMMRSFQNLMLLATLIPSIVHAYAHMLTIVDEETNRAVAQRRKVIFKLNGFGGIWGALGDDDEQLCGVKRTFNHKEMEPVMWRLTVRALLKIDVYGISGRCGSDVALADPFHLGLKDIVLMMENKAKARHEFMDAMIDAGVWKQPDCSTLGIHTPGETPQCQRIIAIARSSVEKLYIA